MSFIVPGRPVLVYLAGGVQGGAVVRAALDRGHRVRAAVRDRRRAAALEALGVEVAEADLGDPASLARASEGAGHAVIQVPTGPAEVMQAHTANALSAARRSGLASIVLKLASASRHPPCAEPSFLANALIEDQVRASGLPFALVRPTLYLDNLMKPSARREIRETGVFAPPLSESLPVAWTSAEDCAAAAIQLLERGVDGGDHRIAGPESLTGDELARRLTAGLGRPVSFRAQGLDDFEREVDEAMGAGMGRRVASKFRFFEADSRAAEAILSRPFEPKGALVDFRPASVEDWPRRHRALFDRPD